MMPRKIRQQGWYVSEMADADGEYSSSGRKRFTIFKLQLETGGRSRYRSHHFGFDLRHKMLLKLERIVAKCQLLYGSADVSVRNRMLRTEIAKRKLSIRIVEARGEPLRLQLHLFGHLGDPELHGSPDDPVAYPPLLQ